jgi:hypothetical protein
MAGINPTLVLALQHWVAGDQIAILEDPNLSRMVLHLDDPPPCCVGHAVMIAADGDHPIFADASIHGQNGLIWPRW